MQAPTKSVCEIPGDQPPVCRERYAYARTRRPALYRSVPSTSIRPALKARAPALRSETHPRIASRSVGTGSYSHVTKPLRLEEIRKIVDLLLEQLRERLADRQIGLELTDAARTYVANRGYDPVYGARPLKRLLQRELETRIGRKLIAGEIADGHTILVDVANGELTVEQVKHAGAER